MYKWVNIVNGSQKICDIRVWFSKVKDTESWTPLRVHDCKILNQAYYSNTAESSKTSVVIECGRASADIENGVIRYNFYNAPLRKLCSSTWFTKEGDDKDIKLTPIYSEKDEALIEGFYQEALQASTSPAKLNEFLKNEVQLVDKKGYKIYLVKNGDKISIRRKNTSILSLEGYVDLQRGYGEYQVFGEMEELALGPVTSLVFVIHGIGEALWSREDVMIPGMVESCESMRATINKKLYDSWMESKQRAERAKQPAPSPPHRIELIPVEWYDKIHSASSSLKNDLISTTLETIPKLRSIANDVIFDVLMYMTPEFAEKVLMCVTEQICDLYEGFKMVHKDVFQEKGSVSIIGHSLGSVIAWDLLALLGDRLAKEGKDCMGNEFAKGTKNDPIVIDDDVKQTPYKLPSNDVAGQDVVKAYASETQVETMESRNTGTWGPSAKVNKTITFTPKFTMFVGSPLGLFLTLRGARNAFEQLRLLQYVEGSSELEHDNDAPSTPFLLPSGSVYNIFHPSDPIAYRIEPILLPPDVPDKSMPQPCHLVLDGKYLRLHVRAKEFGDSIAKTFSGLFKSGTSFLEKIPDSGTTPNQSSVEDVKKRRQKGPIKYKFALGGKSDRVDFQLQPSITENEYLSAVYAHSCYWGNHDFLEFIIQCAQGE